MELVCGVGCGTVCFTFLVPAGWLGGVLRFVFFRKRFDIWCQALKSEDAKKKFEEIMPPLDVIMVIFFWLWWSAFLAG